MSFFEPFMCPVQQREGTVGASAPAPPAPYVAPEAARAGIFKAKPVMPLTLGLTLKGELVWVFPINLKKENKA